MNNNAIRRYFEDPRVVAYYAAAVKGTGLWVSEEKLFRRLFHPRQHLLELGCGAGRIAIGMHGLGFHDILATDLCPKMVQEFRRICRLLELSIPSKLVDATAIPFADNIFDGVIFGFNGLMQIPGAANRQRAVHEVYRVLRPGHFFVFTTHDRDHWKFKDYWKKELLRWRKGQQQPELIDFGDMFTDTVLGQLFIHVPTIREVIDMLKAAGFMVEANMMRSKLANEPLKVREFADDCRFWVAMKPSGG